MKHFSDSPGSIYPALRRLHRKGLVAVVQGAAASRRRKTLFRTSPVGRKALRAWISQPITRDDIVWSLQELKLRFAYSGALLSRDEILRFLEALERELLAYIADLAGYYRSTAPGMALTGRLALKNGIDECRANARWARLAWRQVQREIADQ
jgi:DNA-binding PadR family transcriptional regulator